MGWYLDEYLARTPITVDVTTGSPTTPNDVQVIWGKGEDDLYLTSQANGFDIVPAKAYGHGTLLGDLDFDLPTYSPSPPSAMTMNVDNFPWTHSRQTGVFFIYYDDKDDDATDQSISVTPASAIQGQRAKVHPEKGGGLVVYAQREAAGALLPSTVLTKSTDESQMIWFNIEALLGKSEYAVNGSLLAEEVLGISYFVLDAGTDQTAMRDVSKTLMYQEDRGHGDRWVGVYVTGGSDGSDYTVQLLIDTCTDSDTSVERTLDVRCLLQVQDVED